MDVTLKPDEGAGLLWAPQWIEGSGDDAAPDVGHVRVWRGAREQLIAQYFVRRHAAHHIAAWAGPIAYTAEHPLLIECEHARVRFEGEENGMRFALRLPSGLRTWP